MSMQSMLLTEQENHQIRSLMEANSQKSLAVAVAKVHLTEPATRHKQWTKRIVGVVCFVRDSQRKSYYIMVFDMSQMRLVWEQELYEQIQYKTPHIWFHMFEAAKGMAGIEFIDEGEADRFKLAIRKRLHDMESKALRTNRQGNQPAGRESRLVNASSHGHQPSGPVMGAITPIATDASSEGKKRKKKSKKKKTKRPPISKDEISKPTEFIHVSGIQSSIDGFKAIDNSSKVDPRLRQFLAVAGVAENTLTDPQQRKEIEAFFWQNDVSSQMDPRRSHLYNRKGVAPKVPTPRPEIKRIHPPMDAMPIEPPPLQRAPPKPSHTKPGPTRALAPGALPRAALGTLPRAKPKRVPITETIMVAERPNMGSPAAPHAIAPSYTSASHGPPPPAPPAPPPPPPPPFFSESSKSTLSLESNLPKPSGIPNPTKVVGTTGRVDLMAEIRNRGGISGGGLHRVSDRDESELSSPRDEDTSLTSILKNALTTIQTANLGSSSEDDDVSTSDSWSDDETEC